MDEKTKCQVFTPISIAETMLDLAGYSHNLFDKKILENSCGDGGILGPIVKRYIEDSLSNYKTLEEIRNGLQSNIYGVEIDKKQHQKCLANLNKIAEQYGLESVSWNLINGDALLSEKLVQNLVNFDYVIGNPPYIMYQELSEQTRQSLKKQYVTCNKGKFDYCYAFIEAGIKSLSNSGKLVYLIPNSIFKNVFGASLRKFMLPDLHLITDYTSQKLFPEAITSSAIIVVDKRKVTQSILYHDVVSNEKFKINKKDLGDKWIFSKNSNSVNPSLSKKRFGDYFKVSNTVATLLNDVYVLREYSEDETYYRLPDGFLIEKSITKPTASPKSLKTSKNERIIFPYLYENDQLIRLDESQLKKSYPYAYQYLLSCKEELGKRKSDRNALWYEYGRTQALKHINKEKLLLSTLVTNKVQVYHLTNNCIPYSGLYIIPTGSYSLKIAEKILKSSEFENYVFNIGINASGKSKRITSKDISNFYF